MSEPLLTTKFHIPSSRADFVPRPQLIERLNASLSGKLTLVTAPAGFGKTALVAKWVGRGLPASYQKRVSWLSLDQADNTPIQFWTYFVAALKRVSPEIGKTIQTAFQTTSSLPSIETVLTSLINDLAENAQPLLLGLDDFHEITNADIHRGVAFLIENLSTNFKLVILSREDLPFSVSRYRVSGQLTEIRAADLRFSREESTTLFNELLALSLTPEDVETLNKRTEGWVAGLQLAALSLKSTAEKSAFIQDFAGSHRFLTDYLIDEVLSRQTEASQKFLWRTAILKRFSAAVCDALMENGNSLQILRQLEQANLFLVPLDEERRWFRYHHLFAEFLRLRLHENEAQLIPELYQRAIDWFEQAGLHREALGYALQGQDYAKAAALVEKLAPQALAQYQHRLVILWCQEIPAEVQAQRPFLLVYLGWAYVLAGEMDAASAHFKSAERHCDPAQDAKNKTIRGYILAHRTYILMLQGGFDHAIDNAQQALHLLPSEEVALRAWVAVYLGNAYNYVGRLQDAKNTYRTAIQTARTIPSLSLAEYAYAGLGEILREEGRLTEAQSLYQQFLSFAEELTGQALPPLVGQEVLALGVIHRERYELEEAQTQLEKGISLCREWQQGVALAIGLLELAELHRLQGNFSEAATTLQEVRQIAAQISSWAVALVDGVEARLALSRGDLNAVTRWAENANLSDEDCERNYDRFPECPALIRLYIQTGQAQRALNLLDKMLVRDERAGRAGRVLDLMILKVAALDALGETDSAFGLLSHAVQLAQPEEHLRPFVDAGVVLAPYIARLTESAFRVRLQAILGVGHPPSSNAEQAQPTSEPLNEREVSVLKLMAAGLSNREIGDELYLSVNTIRWYASQIYAKLGVKNRSAAVAKARELGVL
jgi:LuxR family maltose regulon positive regulatory protein